MNEKSSENVGKSGQNGEWCLSSSCRDAIGDFDGKKWLEKFRETLTEADREHKKELEQDVRAGNPEAISAKAALAALAPGASVGPERQRD